MSSVQDDHGGGQNWESSHSSGEEYMDPASENFEDLLPPVTQPVKRRARHLRSPLHTSMYQAAYEGDWLAAQIVLQMDPNFVREEITKKRDTALHVAAIAKQTKFVKKLVKEMDRDDLSMENALGYTAFIYAAGSGVVEIAAVMREKRSNLVTHCSSKDQKMPIYWAALLGHAEMVSYLYELTRPEDLPTKDWFALLLATIEKRMYDVALKILRSEASLATMRETESGGRQALRLLAEHDISKISSCHEAFLQSLVRMSAAIPCLSWLKRICERPLMRKKAWTLAKEIWDEIPKVEDADLFNKLINKPPILHAAAKVGNVEFITMLTSSDPDLIIKSENKKLICTMFHIAVKERQENVLRLFQQIGAMKDWIALGPCDEDGNNILHLAAKLAPPNRLKIVAGPALQMQRELMWFKEVEKIVPSSCRNAVNKEKTWNAVIGKVDVENLTPRELFSKHHAELLKDGETWMKDTANYCMVTAALIATMVFAASITVPGGNDGEKGSPILVKRSFFTVFVVSDVVSMFFSTLSIIMFLSILTSRFQEDDFLVSLPAKLIVGLTALFLSIVSAIGAFTSTCFLLFNYQSAWIGISVSALLCFLLIFIFVLLHFRLWIDTVRTTCNSSFLFRPSNHSLFRNSPAKCRFYLRFAGCTCTVAKM